MKNFDWEELKSKKIAIHCSAEKKANDFLNQAFKHGFTLLGSNHLFDNLYVDEEKNTCYRVDNMGGIFHSSLQFYCEHNYKIIEWETNDMEEFTEKDLKVGMVVKTTSFDTLGYGMIMPTAEGNIFAYKDGHWGNINFDAIKKVWGYSSSVHETMEITEFFRELLYERKEPKKMTVKEICKELVTGIAI